MELTLRTLRLFALSEVGIESREEEDKSNKSKPGAHLGEILLRTSKMESINRLKLANWLSHLRSQ